MYDLIRSAPLELPPEFDAPTGDLIAQLLTRDPTRRLGNAPGDGDVEAVKAHPFFRGLDWEALFHRRVAPPWRPPIRATDAAADTANFDGEFTSEPVCDSLVSGSQLLSSSAPRFDGFTYQAPSHLLAAMGVGAGGHHHHHYHHHGGGSVGHVH
jgi:serum/glucocorticoid-regulated kinase 2